MSGRTTDKYVKIKKLSETAPENEIRIRAIPQIGRYISYAASLLLEKKLDVVLIKASGNAAKNACQIAEILRHRISGLHQLNELKTISVTDEYEPREEGLDKVVMERQLAVLEINLSLKTGVLDTKAPGYQAPLPADQVQEDELKNILEGRRRGGDRPDRPPRDEGRGEGRGEFRRGRFAGPRGGFRGRGRGGRGRGDFEGGRGQRDYEGGRGQRDYEGGRGQRDYEGGRGQRDYEGGRGQRDYEGGRGQRDYEGGRGPRDYEGGRGSRGTRGGRYGRGSRGGPRNE